MYALTSHFARATGATIYIENGGNVEMLKELGGWSSGAYHSYVEFAGNRGWMNAEVHDVWSTCWERMHARAKESEPGRLEAKQLREEEKAEFAG